MSKVAKVTLFAMVQQYLRYQNRERWFRRVVSKRRVERTSGFFDSYPEFFSSSTIALPDRINQRYRALIEWNSDILAGLRVLDLASHDGRWSFAAYKAGAKYVLGIEARPHLVDAARRNLLKYQVEEGRVEFVQGDVMVELDRVENRAFDTVFCFGFFYHTLDHMVLLRKIARIKPTSLVLDTSISMRAGSIIEVGDEEVELEGCAAFADAGTPVRAIIGFPSKSAVEIMLKAAGFSDLRYWDWMRAGIRRWNDLQDYYLGERITLRAKRAD